MTTKDPDFSSAVHRLSNMVITEEILLNVEAYQKQLINALVYPMKDKHQEPLTSRQKDAKPNRKPEKLKTDRILIEIRMVEGWLKKHWSRFWLDNNRKLAEQNY